ncbi:MAG: hypothetical protein K6T91_06530 [Firmicutes bacterium]|nr:hypothetical protein [Bacillota bacterium]
MLKTCLGHASRDLIGTESISAAYVNLKKKMVYQEVSAQNGQALMKEVHISLDAAVYLTTKIMTNRIYQSYLTRGETYVLLVFHRLAC